MADVNTKRVRVMVELDNSFLRMLSAELSLNGTVKWQDTGKELTASQVLALGIFGEARGAHEHEIEAMIPNNWRPNIKLVHEERKVIGG